MISFVDTGFASEGNKREVKRSIHRGKQGVSKNLYNSALFLFLEYHLQIFTPFLPCLIVKTCQPLYSILSSITDVPSSSNNCVLVSSSHVWNLSKHQRHLLLFQLLIFFFVCLIFTTSPRFIFYPLHTVYLHPLCLQFMCTSPHAVSPNIPEQAVPLFSGVFSLSVFLFLYYLWFN
jgi:hypothetical protein